MRRIALAALAASLPLHTQALAQRSNPTLYALQNGFGNAANNLLLTLDPADGAILTSLQVTIPDHAVRNSNGLARHPSTGVLYALLRATPSGGGPVANVLTTLDPSSAVATILGPLDDSFAGIAFLPDGRLLAVTGDGANDPEALYEINTADTTATRLAFLGNGDDGETIGTTTDGRIYHASGLGAGFEYFERLDLAGLLNITDLLPSHTYDLDEEILALTWSTSLNQMFGANAGNQLFTIDTNTGQQTLVGNMGQYCKGLAFVGPTLYALENSGPASPRNIHQINTADGSVIATVPLSLPGFTVNKGNGLARHPLTGDLYAILQVTALTDNHTTSRRLVTLDPLTGNATDVGPLADAFAGLAFLPLGTLLAVTGDGANAPEALFTISTTDASITYRASLGHGDDGESIAIDANGLLFHASGIDPGDQFFERLDANNLPSTPFITDIGDGSHTFNYDEATALAFSAELDQMFLADLIGNLYTIDTDTGATTLVGLIGATAPTIKGLAFVNPLIIPCPGDANGDNVVDFLDLNIVLSFFSQPVAPGTNGDLNNDGVVDFLDLNIVLSFFGVSC